MSSAFYLVKKLQIKCGRKILVNTTQLDSRQNIIYNIIFEAEKDPTAYMLQSEKVYKHLKKYIAQGYYLAVV